MRKDREPPKLLRETLIGLLKIHYRVGDSIMLMNKLQDEGLVSDEAVTIDDVAGIDLVNAYEKVKTE